MSERKPSLLIKDILNCIENVSTYTSDFSFESFTNNYMVLEACLYNIQVIGEAVSKLPENIKSREPAIPWSLIKGMRNRLVHEYFGTDTEIIWKVIKLELPAIVNVLNKLHESLISEGR